MIKYALVVLILLSGFNCTHKSEVRDGDREEVFRHRADSIMALMTLDEKIGQLNLPAAGDITTGQASNSNVAEKIKNGQVGGLFNLKSAEKIREVQRLAVEESRLGIPLLFGMDVIHGYETIFPIPLGLSSSWDMDLIKETARIAANEASADGISWTFSPMTDISRDPRWGRVSEGNGEDPYLASQIAKAMVEGYQGNDLSLENTIMACVKHFALYGAGEAGRDYNTVDMSKIRMYNEYFPPYKAAIDAGVGTVMTAFNEVDGIPASANRWLMTQVLREDWGFDGFVVTDYTAIEEMIDHGIGDLDHVSALALKAGVDMDMVSEGFLTTLKSALQQGKISEKDIDDACRRILIAKLKLGLFEDPYRYADPERAKKEVFSDDNRKRAREIASQTFVLLKNDNGTLPLKKGSKIALVGPMADNAENMSGTWSVAGNFGESISLRKGLENALGDGALISYAKGSNVVVDSLLESRVSIFGKPTYRDPRSEQILIEEALVAAKDADVIIAAVGESAEMSGESSSLTTIELPENQRNLLKALHKTGKPVIVVLFTGRPIGLGWEKENIPAILNVWFAGSEAGDAIADALFGEVNPSGKLTMTFPQNVGQIPLYYNHKNTGRPLAEGKWFEKFRSNYLDVTNEPLYPFGFGLSYTSFQYGEMEFNKVELKGDDKLLVKIPVTNIGQYSGQEVVQLYIRDKVASVTRPVKELKGFQKIQLEIGQTKLVEFEITVKHLKFYDYDLNYVWESGDFEIMIGGDSQQVKSKTISWKN
ncbi:beta-glucosidase BglX [Mongoliitalea daihaiensis]|uniref:beta-glucosidase BglX n=1 Tax=Mongoliitalea daihaiensis TaxID=2782006 RepID=UPI0021D3F7EC|nr:beta-glucosidase BglX [Mongoliitalea daihaiensis]UJP63411.1 beta-glucosidase BglX [Mongoliitalea daihaiensis]